MKRIVLGTALAALLWGSGNAADIAGKVPPIPVAVASWTGCYIGAHGGYGWSKNDVSAVPLPNADGSPNDLTNDVPPQSLSVSGRGATFGGQAGCNWQSGANWVFGIEGDVSAAGINGNRFAAFPSVAEPNFSTDSFDAKTNIEALASIRGRVGYSWGPGMLYVTGGGAWERLQVAANLNSTAAPRQFAAAARGTDNFDRFGWVAGIGSEWKVASNWSVRAEYLYYRFDGSNTFQSFTSPCGSSPTNICSANHTISGNSVNAVRLGVNYLFGDPAVAKY